MISTARFDEPALGTYRTSRSASAEKNYLCTFLNELGERVDVFEDVDGETFFMTHRRDVTSASLIRPLLRTA